MARRAEGAALSDFKITTLRLCLQLAKRGNSPHTARSVAEGISGNGYLSGTAGREGTVILSQT